MAIYDRDYLTTLPLLYEKASEYSGGDWNKYNSDVGDTILKLLATTSHTVDYYFRRFLNSLFLPNDNWDQQALIWELTGYKPNYLRADYLMVQLYWPDCGLDSYVPIYQYTPFKVVADDKEYTFLCAQDYILQPRTTRANIRLVNGSLETIDQDYTEVLNTNKIKLTDDDIDYDLVTVVISGVKWKQVRNVFYSPDTERIFSVHKEIDGTYLYLHSSWKEYLDDYDTSFIIYFVKSYYDFTMYTDDCMTVEFKTELYTVDGDEVSQYYKIIPLINSDEALDAANLMPSTTEGNRAITVLDFESNAALFPGIVSCKAYDWNTPEVCRNPFEVTLIACDSKGQLSEHMKQVLKAYLESISSPLINVNVVAPIFATQNILVLLDIGDYRGTLAEIELKNIVIRTLKEFYAIGNLKPGRVVKTKELNSLILHADSRIYFATTSFMNRPVNSPFLIPVLGNVVVITSAEAFTYYDFGVGHDKGYVNINRYDWLDSSEQVNSQTIFVAHTLHVNGIVPIDKLPMQLFDAGDIEIPPLQLQLGSGEMPIADFAYSEFNVHVLANGGDPDGPKYAFVYETDGSANLIKSDRYITSVVDAALQFTNPLGEVLVDPEIHITVKHDDINEIKAGLANALNTMPDLLDAEGYHFNLTASDISYPGDEIPVPPPPVVGKGISHVQPSKAPGVDSAGFSVDTDKLFSQNKKVALGASEGAETDIQYIQSADQGTAGFDARTVENAIPKDLTETVTVTEHSSVIAAPEMLFAADDGIPGERSFIYVPYNNVIVKDRLKSKEQSDVHKINFMVKTSQEHTMQNYLDFGYNSVGRYTSVPHAYGDMQFTANTTLNIIDEVSEFSTVRPELYEEAAEYKKQYIVKEKDGNALHWYFVNISPVHSVAGTYEIGYGIYVSLSLLRDTAIYVEADTTTTRGFIYSSEMTINDFSILESINFSVIHH